MVKVLGVAFSRPPGVSSSAAHQAFELLMRENWELDGAALSLIVAPCRWWGAVEMIEAAAEGMDAIVLFGSRGPKQKAHVARYGRNEARRRMDEAGLRWPGHELAPRAAFVIPATLSADRMAQALQLAGLPAKTVIRGDRYIYNHCFYRLLARSAAPQVALVRLPMSLEAARADGRIGYVNRMQVVAGVASALAFAAAAADARNTEARPAMPARRLSACI